MEKVKLTCAEAIIKYLCAQFIEIDGQKEALFKGVFAIFGHGNLTGLGEALYHYQDRLPTYRGQNEQSMAHAAIAFAKASKRQQMMACTTSIGPGATNMVTAAALAHVNRLPVLLLPGDVFASRAPDPVLQQIEDFTSPLTSANDCFKPVSRFFDRIYRPEQIITSLPQALRVLTDPANCGPVTLCLPQDVQTMAFDYPLSFFNEKIHTLKRPQPDNIELEKAYSLIKSSQKPLIIAGGGVHYSDACNALSDFASKYQIPVAETQAGKGALTFDHPQNVGSIGVTGNQSANQLAREADLIIALGTRLGDFTTGSRALFHPNSQLIQINVSSFDAIKHHAHPVIADIKVTLEAMTQTLTNWSSSVEWCSAVEIAKTHSTLSSTSNKQLPSDADVLRIVNQTLPPTTTVVCAAGGLPGELHKNWQVNVPGTYHLEYGYSCMGYEIAGGLGVKMAKSQHEVVVMVGDGSYLMMNSEIVTSIQLKQKLIIVVLDNGGYGCIHRLQTGCGSESFNNLLSETNIDFALHAKSLGATSEAVDSLTALEQALKTAKAASTTYVVVIKTDPTQSTQAGGTWWDVPIGEVSQSAKVKKAFSSYQSAKKNQNIVGYTQTTLNLGEASSERIPRSAHEVHDEDESTQTTKHQFKGGRV
ncbi:MAG: 3D-(3,5/4)-trihydroxycyclohexane-1,2-dione acylhydrolase (decyclizing) [Gammaproteobacteria bacterium]